MSTIATLVARLEGDNSGLSSTLQDSARKLKQFYGDAVGKFDVGISPATLERQARTIASTMTSALGKRFAEASLSLKEQLFSGMINESEFRTEGAIAAKAFNDGLTAVIQELGDKDFLPPALEADLVAQYKTAGLEVGRAFATAQKAELQRAQLEAIAMNAEFNRATAASAAYQAGEQSRIAGNIRNALGAGVQQASVLSGALDTMGFRANRAGISILFAFEAFARGGEAGERGIVRALRAVSTLAVAFGPEGWLVAAAAAGVAAIIDHMDRLTKAMDKVHKKFEEKFKELANTFNNEGMVAEVRKLDLGDAANGMGMGGGYLGSINDLKARIPMEQGQLLEAIRRGDQNMISRLQEDLRQHNAQLKELSDERAQYVAKIMDPNEQLPGYAKPKIGLGPMKITANAPSKDAAEEKKHLEELSTLASRLMETWTSVTKEHGNSAGLMDRMLTLHKQIEQRLAGMKDKASDFAVTLRKALAELDKDPFIALLAGAGTGQLPLALPTLTSNGNTHTAYGTEGDKSATGPMAMMDALLRRIGATGVVGAPTQKVDAGVLSNTIGPELAATFRQVGTDIKAQLGGTLMSLFGPVALLMRALEPALRVIGPILDAFVAPLAAVAQVVAVAIKPTLQLLFPILRAVAIAFAFLDSIVMRVTAGIATAIGKAIQAIGAVIAHIPFLGGLGRSIENAGKSILNFAEGQYQAADQMDRVRQKLESMSFGTTADAITGLGDAANAAASVLNDVPNGYKVALDRFLATDPRTMQPGAAAAAAGSGGSGGVVVNGDVYVDARAKSPKEMFDAVREVARTNARSQFGDTQRAPDTLK